MRSVLPRSLALALALVACDDDAVSHEGVGDVLVTPPPRVRAEDPIYDAEGLVRESDVVMAGLRLPRGLEPVEGRPGDRRHVYRSVVPRQKLLQYFGPRLTTVDIRHEGSMVTYRDARPRDARGGVVLLDVSIEPSSERGTASLVTIYERPPPLPPGTVVSDEEVRRRLRDLSRPRE
ncbi:MAG: hypothetical protein AB7S26_04965 [Sandaracinaceae bacterium]